DRNHACFHPEDLNRLWEGPIPENGGWHLAQEVKMAANKRFYWNKDDLNSGKAIICFLLSYKLQKPREDLKDLYKLVKARYGSTRLVEELDLVLWNDLKNMFEPHVEDTIYMLIEKKYPLAPLTLSQMLEKKLQIDYERRIVGIKSLLNVVSITATLIDVNAAQSKLVLLEEFNENYSKCLRLLVKLLLLEEVTTASGS
ncbi:hypothetical protein Tco_1139923, partial [Tanacetum coccineum]